MFFSVKKKYHTTHIKIATINFVSKLVYNLIYVHIMTI